MKSSIRKVRAALFGLSLSATLGFGATQAFATPQTAPSDTARLCDDLRCNQGCQNKGYSWGYCSTSWSCTCE
ncbi:MAG: hypothetical protein AB1941_26340 [Gemmatimonadota bacterium]